MKKYNESIKCFVIFTVSNQVRIKAYVYDFYTFYYW